jgi:hypothetical protein|nr:MAG TPA: hypothetical protein [Caudoviricetes sp.]
MSIYNNLILASFIIWVLLSVYQIYQHCKGNFKYYKVSNRYINFIIMLIVMLVMWFVLINMKYDELMEVCHVKY